MKKLVAEGNDQEFAEGERIFEIVETQQPLDTKVYFGKYDDDSTALHPRTASTWSCKVVQEKKELKEDERLNWLRSHIELDKYEQDEHWTN